MRKVKRDSEGGHFRKFTIMKHWSSVPIFAPTVERREVEEEHVDIVGDMDKEPETGLWEEAQ